MSWHTRPCGSVVVSVRLTLHPGEDDDLIAIVNGAKKGMLATVIRETMRSGIVKTETILPEDEDEKACLQADCWEL